MSPFIHDKLQKVWKGLLENVSLKLDKKTKSNPKDPKTYYKRWHWLKALKEGKQIYRIWKVIIKNEKFGINLLQNI